MIAVTYLVSWNAAPLLRFALLACVLLAVVLATPLVVAACTPVVAGCCSAIAANWGAWAMVPVVFMGAWAVKP